MIVIASGILLILIGYAKTQDANCDFTQNVAVGTTYYLTSPGYPSNYVGGRQCRWIATCPTGYNCKLDCNPVNIPSSTSCSMDRLLISKSGDPTLSSADTYCGSGTVTAVSTQQTISIGLITANNSTGGRFSCALTAQSAASPPCSCGYKKMNRIVGGQETRINEFPMMAGIVDTRISQIKCGAVIIDEWRVLTAAHCLSGLPLTSTGVIVGEHNTTYDDSPATQGFAAASFIIHPQFNSVTHDNDIAIINLQQKITFSDRVGPVCLPFKFVNDELVDKTVTILGWGTKFFGGPTSKTLQKVDVKVISQATCRMSTPTLTDRQMCTYTPLKDACQDDSGGPLLYTDPSTGLLFSVGVVSFGTSCASGYPGVNTRVSALLSWILANTSNSSFCRK